MSSGPTFRRSTVSKHEVGRTLVGGGVAAVVLFLTIIWVGRVGAFEALRLIEAAVPTARFFAAAVVGGALTVLALLLTLLGLSLGTEFHFGDTLYARAAFLTRLSVISIVLATGILLAVAVPIEEVEELATYYAAFYYVLAGALAVLGGLVITIGLLIGLILRGVIAIDHSGAESDLVPKDEQLPERDDSRD
ncbi:MAG: hypothetical protein ACRDVL_13160 [Acidimicrobiia bacterium]